MEPKITIKEIAKLAGVSVSTVSQSSTKVLLYQIKNELS